MYTLTSNTKNTYNPHPGWKINSFQSLLMTSHEKQTFLDGGYIATRLLIAVAFSDLIIMNMIIAAGDLAETNFVLFMTKIESCIIWKGFSLCSNDKCFTEIQFYANN